jgi:methylmalonyl-CoA mutase
MRPDFTKIDCQPETAHPDCGADALVRKRPPGRQLAGMEHLDYAAGIPPYLRGPYSTMYVLRPWTIGVAA